jgi:hypothetical protein
MMSTLFLLLFLGLGLWGWQNSLRAWEQAREAAERICRQCGVQLLDDTVALERLGWRRDRRGKVNLERVYSFEFTDTGSTRRLGRVILIGRRVEVVAMEDNDLLIP